jgi:hypothetical protein
MKLRHRQLLRKRSIDKIYTRERLPHLLDGRTPTEKQRYQLKLCDVIRAVLRLAVMCISNEVQPRNAESHFVYSVVIQRIILHDACHSYHGIMILYPSSMPERKCIPTRCNNYFVPVRALVIKRSAEIKILGFVGRCRTHNFSPPSFSIIL